MARYVVRYVQLPGRYCRQPLTNRPAGIIILEMAGRFPLPAAAGPEFIPAPLRQTLGISPVVGRLTLDQEAEVRALHPQPLLPLNSATDADFPLPVLTFDPANCLFLPALLKSTRYKQSCHSERSRGI